MFIIKHLLLDTFGFLITEKVKINLGVLVHMSCALLKYCTVKKHIFLALMKYIQKAAFRMVGDIADCSQLLTT